MPDTGIEQTTPLAAPPPSTFALVPEAGRAARAVGLKLAALGVALAVACGALYVALGELRGDDPKPATAAAVPKAAPPVAPPARKKPVLTTDRARIGSVLKNLAIAEEVYATDHDGRYTTRMSALRDEGFADDPAVRTRVRAANAGRYCISAAGAGRLVLFYDSATGRASTAPCS